MLHTHRYLVCSVLQNLFQYGGPQYPQMYGAPGALSPGSGPVYPYGSFTTQPLQGGPVYPGTAQYGYQAPQLYGPAAAGLTTLAPPYSGSGSLPASTPAGGTIDLCNFCDVCIINWLDNVFRFESLGVVYGQSFSGVCIFVQPHGVATASAWSMVYLALLVALEIYNQVFASFLQSHSSLIIHSIS